MTQNYGLIKPAAREFESIRWFVLISQSDFIKAILNSPGIVLVVVAKELFALGTEVS